jgi:ribosomal-protein-alanine N-acetyltransferase
MRFIRVGRPETVDETAQLVEQYISQHRTRGWTKWRLATHEGDLVGRAGFGGDDVRRGLSFAIDRRLWGQGLATEIASALVRWHWEHAAEAELRGLVEIGNDASVAVLKKVGFEETGTESFGESLCLAFLHRGRARLGRP